MTTIILAVCFIPVWFVMYFLLRNTVNPEKNIIIGVTLPQSTHNESETQAICASFRKWLNITMIPLLILKVPPFFLQSIGAAVTWLFIWVLLVLIEPMAVFAIHRGRLMALKRSNNWYNEAPGSDLDEDEYWLLGLFYHNPNDGRFLVNARIGMNMSVNLAKPAGKLIIALSALCIAAMPFVGIWLCAEELTPTRLILNETTLTASHTSERYVIQLDAIESIELIEEMPRTIRTAGISMPNLCKGHFRVTGYGSSRLNIQPLNPPFLVIKSRGHTYIVNDAENKVTREVYAFIRSGQ